MLRAAVFAVPVLVATCHDCDGSGATDLPGATFLIEAGDHDSDPGGIRATRVQSDLDRWVAFQARFGPSAAYTTATPSNQHDWNKLMGLTTADIHEDSIRLGWRWDPEAQGVDLGFYGYRDGARISEELTTVPLDTWVDVRLEMTDSWLYASADGHDHDAPPVTGGGPRTTWVLRSAYFGGDETAPHDIRIDVRDVRTDP